MARCITADLVFKPVGRRLEFIPRQLIGPRRWPFHDGRQPAVVLQQRPVILR